MVFRITHIILALLIFISSTGFVLNKHYCQNELKSVALFLEAESCHQTKAFHGCPTHSSKNSDNEKKSQGCCDDETNYIKSENDQFPPLSKVDNLLPLVLLSVIFVALKIESNSFDKRSIQFFNYKPPLIIFDLPVSLQTFRC